MRSKMGLILMSVLAGGLVLTAVIALTWPRADRAETEAQTATEVVERREYSEPPQRRDEVIVDDRLEEKEPLAFDESVVDSRPLEGWEVNASAAVLRLDCPMLRPDWDAEMLALRPSYAAGMAAPGVYEENLLASVNLLDEAAKQFDDGLYAAVDLACYRGELGLAPAAPEVIRSIWAKLPTGSPARPFLAAALDLAGHKVSLTAEEKQTSRRRLNEFQADQAASKPLGFYDWTPELGQVWRFYRFLQQKFYEADLTVCRDVAAVLEHDSDLLGQYHAIEDWYRRLTNPSVCLSADLLIGAPNDLKMLADRHGRYRAVVALWPPSASRETELFERLFPLGIPQGTELMTTLVQRIRSGEVDLKPGPKDGWYQYQVYALETLLLPTRGQERDKLLLTAHYKKRLLETFQALVTTRRETHIRQLAPAEAKAAEPLGAQEVRPRLRIEPCPTFYLRTARAYAFVENLLLATAGRERLTQLHGLKQGGARSAPLAEELEAIRLRFYGFYLISCEDTGLLSPVLIVERVG